MTRAELTELKRLLEEATPGPWAVYPVGGYTQDEIVTEHPYYTPKPSRPHANHVVDLSPPLGDHPDAIGTVGLAAGHPEQRFSQNAALIVALANAAPELIACAERVSADPDYESVLEQVDKWRARAEARSRELEARNTDLEGAAVILHRTIVTLEGELEGAKMCLDELWAERQQILKDAGSDELALIARAESAEAQLAQQSWRPIETAPRDGTEVLLLAASYVFIERMGGGTPYRGWREHKGAVAYPTHFMPLPLPPTKQEG